MMKTLPVLDVVARCSLSSSVTEARTAADPPARRQVRPIPARRPMDVPDRDAGRQPLPGPGYSFGPEVPELEDLSGALDIVGVLARVVTYGF